MKKGKAKRLVMQRQYRSQVVRDKTRYRRNSKHKKPPIMGLLYVYWPVMRNQLPSGG